MPITNYEQYMSPDLGRGRVASYQDHRGDTGSATGKIEWGKAVQYNAQNPNKVETYDGSGDFVGIAIANHYSDDYDSVGAYEANDAVSFLRRGIIVVEVLEDVLKGEKAVIDNATGKFRPSDTATPGKSGVIGVFKSTASANGLAQVEINLP